MVREKRIENMERSERSSEFFYSMTQLTLPSTSTSVSTSSQEPVCELQHQNVQISVNHPVNHRKSIKKKQAKLSDFGFASQS